MIKAVLFDVDGVLIDSFAANLKFFHDLFSHFGYTPPTAEEYKSLFQWNMKEVIRRVTKSESEEEVRRIWEAGKGRVVPYDMDMLSVTEGASPVIEDLHRHYALGIVTSRVSADVFRHPDLAPLHGHFGAIVSYGDTEQHKPHPEPVLLALRKLGVSARETVFVGDGEVDSQAARAAGVSFIAFRNPSLDADVHIESLGDLPAIVASLSS